MAEGGREYIRLNPLTQDQYETPHGKSSSIQLPPNILACVTGESSAYHRTKLAQVQGVVNSTSLNARRKILLQ